MPIRSLRNWCSARANCTCCCGCCILVILIIFVFSSRLPRTAAVHQPILVSTGRVSRAHFTTSQGAMPGLQARHGDLMLAAETLDTYMRVWRRFGGSVLSKTPY